MKKAFNLLLKIAFVTVLIFLAGLMIAICPTQARGADNYFTGKNFYTSLSLRSPKKGDKTDFEIIFGGEEKNYKFEYLYERDNGEYFKGTDLQWIYDYFRFQWFRRDERNIHFTEAQFSKTTIWGITSGGCLRNDIILSQTKYMALIAFKTDNFKIELKHNTTDYYSFSIQWKGLAYKGFYPLAIYKDVNGNKFWQGKIVYKFKI